LSPEPVTIAQIIKARGRAGEVLAVPLSSHPAERFAQLRNATLVLESGERRAVRIESVWEHQARLVLKFAGVDTIEDAEELAGADLCIDRSDRPAAPEGEFYQSDLIGCAVIDRASGRELGHVRGWQEHGGPSLLEVEPVEGGEPVLIPFARSICVEIAPEQRQIRVDLPEGLWELNRR
jgi:16S rRNA processing protein RimM